MEELVFTKKYDQLTTCTGSILMPIQRPGGTFVWRVRLFDKYSTECVIFLLKLNRELYLKACDVGTKARVRMNLPLSKIRDYRVVCGYWHEITLKDDRKFALRLDPCDELAAFNANMKMMLPHGVTISEDNTDDLASKGSILMGPPISTREAARRALTDMIYKEQGGSHQDGKDVDSSVRKTRRLDSVELRKRPLPPIPDAELEDMMETPDPQSNPGSAADQLLTSVGDLLRSFKEPINWGPVGDLADEDIMNELTDESVLLEEAIQRGDTDEAAYWATELAKRKSEIFVTHISSLDDPDKYIKKIYKKANRKSVSEEGGYVRMERVPGDKSAVYEEVPPPILPRPKSSTLTPSTADAKKKGAYLELVADQPTQLTADGLRRCATSSPKPTPRPRLSPASGKTPSTGGRSQSVKQDSSQTRSPHTSEKDNNLNATNPKRKANETWACWNCSTPNLVSNNSCTMCEKPKQ